MNDTDTPSIVVADGDGREVVTKRDVLTLLAAIPGQEVDVSVAAALMTALTGYSITDDDLRRMHSGLVAKLHHAQKRCMGRNNDPKAQRQRDEIRDEVLKRLGIDR